MSDSGTSKKKKKSGRHNINCPSTMEDTIGFPKQTTTKKQQLIIGLPYDPTGPLLLIYHGLQATRSQRLLHISINSSTLYNSYIMESHKYPTKEQWVRKRWYRYTIVIFSYKEGQSYIIWRKRDATGDKNMN